MWRVDYSIRINIEEIIRRQCGMESTLRRTWAEIDLDALAHNYHKLRERIGADVKFLGVVKADAYGHGSVQVSHLLQELGADYLAVSSIDEAVELRLNDVTMPILILGHTPKEQVSRLIEYHITQAVSCEAKALEYSEEAVKCGGTLKIHIKVDTGMSRLGYLCDGDHFETIEMVRKRYPEKEIFFTEGCVEYSRFADSGEIYKAEMYAHDILGNLNAGINASLDWNLLLDEKGGPNHVGNFCAAPIMCAPGEDSYEKRLTYYYIGHFSRYIKEGAVKIGTSRYTDGIEVTAFLNPDGERVAVILNKSEKEVPYTLREMTKDAGYQGVEGVIAPHSIQTIVY
jgi:hypothetical protein